jgi:hypothetical protein
MKCPVCHTHQVEPRGQAPRVEISCPLCGSFAVHTATAQFGNDPRGYNDGFISSWIRHQNIGGKVPLIDVHSVTIAARSHPRWSVTETTQAMLQHFAKLSRHPGHCVEINPTLDWPLFWCAAFDAFNFYLKDAREQGLFSEYENTGNRLAVALSTKAWDRLNSKSETFLFPDRAFVAMSFASEMTDVWLQGIAPAIVAAGWRAHRVDSEKHIGRIDMKIIDDIRTSRFMVADFSGHRPGVYFEAGYAAALGRPVVWSVRKDQFKKLHFDTRQFSHIVWTDLADLRVQLESLIAGTVGRGPHRS